MLNRYIGGERKRDQTSDLRGIENSDAEYNLVAHGSLAAAAATATTTRGLMHRKRLTMDAWDRQHFCQFFKAGNVD
jgi:hypothetical protein